MFDQKNAPAPNASSPTQSSIGWERELIAKLANSAVVEQRRSRRWGIFFKLLGFTYLVVALLMFGHFDLSATHLSGKHTAMVDLNGVIGDGEQASADNVVAGLKAAFEDENTAGVILRVNSPGGSPVQAGYIYDEIKRLRGEHPDTPLYAVIADICASGGMYVAAAADKVYADKSSLVGSIGVRMDGFGFVGSLEKLGIERRLLTAGAHKGLLDPFLPRDETEVAHMQSLLDEVHKQFIDAVKKGRGARLADDERLFTGLVWTGQQAMGLGLVDALGSPGYVAREVIGQDTIVDFSVKDHWLDRFSERVGASFSKAITETLARPMLR